MDKNVESMVVRRMAKCLATDTEIKLLKDGHEDAVHALYSLRGGDVVRCVCVWSAVGEFRVVQCKRVEPVSETMALKDFKHEVDQVEKYNTQELPLQPDQAHESIETLKKRAAAYVTPDGPASKRRLALQTTNEFRTLGVQH